MSPSYYASDTNFLNVYYAIDIELMTFFSDLLFFSDATKVEYASNSFAFRKRTDNNKGLMSLPFQNLYLNEFRFDNEKTWYNNPLSKTGLFIPEISAKFKMMPAILEFESTFWCNRHDEALYASQKFIHLKENHTELTYELTVGAETIEMIAVLNVTNSFSQEFQENDWLEKNKIHNVGASFEIFTFVPETNLDITIPTEAIFNFANKVGDNIAQSESLEFVIDHLTEDVYEK